MGFYIVPKIGSGASVTDPHRPKYFSQIDAATWPTMAGVLFSGMPYGLEPVYLVGANVTAPQATFLAGQGDVYAVPSLNSQVGGNPTLNQIRTRLEGLGIPGSWVASTTTNRQLLGRLGRVMQIAQRLHGRHNKRVLDGVSLDSNLTQTSLTELSNVGQSLGLDVSGLSTAITVRAAILLLADQVPAFSLAGEVF